MVYRAEDDCRETLVDICRFLRRDDPQTRSVVITMSEWNVMRAHVVPIILQYNTERELLLAATKARSSTQPAPAAAPGATANAPPARVFRSDAFVRRSALSVRAARLRPMDCHKGWRWLLV